MSEKRALLLVGSPRGLERSTSGRLGRRLLDLLSAQGFVTSALHVHEVVRSPSGLSNAMASIAEAELVILSVPLYVDSFPAPAIVLLERIAQDGVGAGNTKLALLIQCGFPEKAQNDTAVAIAEQFAVEVGWAWLGAFALGAAETYGGSADSALEEVARALAEGRGVPGVALRRAMPAWLYRLGGNVMWRRVAARNGVAGKLRARPYED